jgi:hypothetical protein
MTVCDFARSFVTFRIDQRVKQPKTVSRPPPFTLNNARLQLECRCWLTPEGAGPPAAYALTASCKAEQVNVPEDIWHEPGADMCLAASADEFLVVKSWDRVDRGVRLSPPELGVQPERQAGKNADAFDRLRIDVREAPGRLLGTTADVIAAGLEGRPVVSQSEFPAPGGGRVRLEYPVKVLNVSERDGFYQVDTGPVLVPDPEAFDGTHAISCLRLAYIAHNSLGCTELLVNVPTPVGGGVRVNHYARVLKVRADNRMIEVG